MSKNFLYLMAVGCLLFACSFSSSFASHLNESSVNHFDEETMLTETEADPFEDFNRNIFEFNRAIDTIFFRPLAELYREGVPSFARDSIHNTVTNIGLPLVFINDILQLESQRAFETLGRFLINSTLGIGGLFDVATEIGIEYHSEDFGQTLASAGIEGGPYLMLPLLGPSTPRDLLGRIVDVFIDPFNLVMHNNDLGYISYSRTGVDLLDRRTNSIEFTDRVDKSLDPYAQYRSLYIQNRNYHAQDKGNGSSSENEDYKEN